MLALLMRPPSPSLLCFICLIASQKWCEIYLERESANENRTKIPYSSGNLEIYLWCDFFFWMCKYDNVCFIMLHFLKSRMLTMTHIYLRLQHNTKNDYDIEASFCSISFAVSLSHVIKTSWPRFSEAFHCKCGASSPNPDYWCRFSPLFSSLEPKQTLHTCFHRLSSNPH